jgi:uncharacterized membrane protein YkvA (DUF1232 family)
MTIDITISLSDEDLEKFQQFVDQGKQAVASPESAGAVEAAAAKLIEKAREQGLSKFVSERFQKLEVLLNMIRDKEWQLADEENDAIRGALYYFVDAEDVIPDHIPGLGYLDDALYAEIVIRALEAEIETYQEFCRYRSAEENRRRKEGLDPVVGREDWLADKRAVLHLRMRQRRSGRAGGNGWGVRLF